MIEVRELLLDEAAKFGEIACDERELAIMPIVQAYFDESGKLADSDYVVFAGCVASERNWRNISRSWNDILSVDSIPYLSMKEAMQFKGPFAGWAKRVSERDRILKALIKMLMRDVGFLGSSPISTGDFKALPEAYKDKLKNPQYCGFEATVNYILEHLSQNMLLHLYCDCSEEYSVDCLKLYHRLKRTNAMAKVKCVGISFADDQHFPPLQAADLVAYCIRQEKSGTAEPIILELLSMMKARGTAAGSFAYLANSPGLGYGFIEKAG